MEAFIAAALAADKKSRRVKINEHVRSKFTPPILVRSIRGLGEAAGRQGER